jgi:hypothetical protein
MSPRFRETGYGSRDSIHACVSQDGAEAGLAWNAGTIARAHAETQWWDSDACKSMTGSAEAKLPSRS